MFILVSNQVGSGCYIMVQIEAHSEMIMTSELVVLTTMNEPALSLVSSLVFLPLN